MNFSIAYISYNDEDIELKNRSSQILNDFLTPSGYFLNQEEGQLLFIASGGSEQKAIQRTEAHKYIILLCHRENNSYSAALEIAAYLRSQKKRVNLVDVFSPSAFNELEKLQNVIMALESLTQQKAAIVGEISDWLIISDVENPLVKDKLGIDLKRFPWSDLEDYRTKKPSIEFLEHFPGSNPDHLRETAKVYTLLQEVVKEKDLSAISVECYSMVRRDKVTACLPLSVLNSKNIVAACEGDICSMLGKMLIRAIANEIPWQANVAEIKEDTILFAHCTAPLHLLKSFDITTHFETDCGTAIKGKFEHQQVGVFRVNNTLDKYLLLDGEITNVPDHDFACRTQIEVSTSADQAKLLKEQSLGNHHLIFPAKYISLVATMMQVLEIGKVN